MIPEILDFGSLWYPIKDIQQECVAGKVLSHPSVAYSHCIFHSSFHEEGCFLFSCLKGVCVTGRKLKSTEKALFLAYVLKAKTLWRDYVVSPGGKEKAAAALGVARAPTSSDGRDWVLPSTFSKSPLFKLFFFFFRIICFFRVIWLLLTKWWKGIVISLWNTYAMKTLMVQPRE